MTRPFPRRGVAAAAAVLALVTTAGCGGDDGGDDAGPTDSASSASVEDSDPAEAPEGPDPSSDAASELEGEQVDPDEFSDLYLSAMEQATTATLRMKFGGAAVIEGFGAADFGTTPPSMELTVEDDSTGTRQRLVIVGEVIYVGLQPRQYVEYDLTELSSSLGIDLSSQLDPRSMADVFAKGVVAASYVGEEDLRGETMDHYSVLLDSAALRDGAELPSDVPSGTVADTLTVDVWFDDEGFFRRQETEVGAAGGTVEVDYDNWGEPVVIKAPPAAQVTRMPQG